MQKQGIKFVCLFANLRVGFTFVAYSKIVPCGMAEQKQPMHVQKFIALGLLAPCNRSKSMQHLYFLLGPSTLDSSSQKALCPNTL